MQQNHIEADDHFSCIPFHRIHPGLAAKMKGSRAREEEGCCCNNEYCGDKEEDCKREHKFLSPWFCNCIQTSSSLVSAGKLNVWCQELGYSGLQGADLPVL